MSMIKISIIILSHNRLDDLRANLPALLSGLGTEMELVVVDNASTDGSCEFLDEFREVYPTVKLVLHDSNTGVAIGRNSGFRVATGEYVVSLDDDAVMSGPGYKTRPRALCTTPTGRYPGFQYPSRTNRQKAERSWRFCNLGGQLSWGGPCHTRWAF